MPKANAWYVRVNNQVKGPFPAGQISQSLVLGRYTLEQQVSLDREHWQAIASVPELVPEVLKGDPNDPENMERLKAARRWADERRNESHAGNEHRKGENSETREYRVNRENIYGGLNNKREWAALQALIIFGVAGALIYFAFGYEPANRLQEADCDAPPAKGVNWQYCRMPGKQLIKSKLQQANLNTTSLQGANLFASDLTGANLSYAELANANLSFVNFSLANLKGTNLQSSDLSKASFYEADLSYANLQGANLSDTRFNNSRLDHAIWTDGRTCAAGSVDECR